MYEYLGIKINKQDPEFLNEFSEKLLKDYYVREEETIPQAFARAATAYCYGDYLLAQRIYDYAYKGWFMFASPILSNAPNGVWKEKTPYQDRNFWENTETSERNIWWEGETPKAMPISCFLSYTPDTIQGQIECQKELARLSVAGGGVGLHNGIRAASKKAPGPVPFMKVIDGSIGYYRQSSTRRGACAYYMDVSHPDIMEFVKFRIPSGGDSARKSDNRKQFHNAVNVTDDFIRAIVENEYFHLKCPYSGEVRETLKARKIWETILETRALTGEPYIFKIDTANRAMPENQKSLGLDIKGSNLCIEITLPTSEERTAVCCLSSLNVEYYQEWRDTSIVEDLIRFLDNVLQHFIDNSGLEKAVFSATQERAVGLGTMGWHYYLQRNKIPFEGGGVGSAIQHTARIYKHISEKALASSKHLAKERGVPSDMRGTGLRNSRRLALAPNSNNAIILGTSPSIEPLSSNAYTHSTRAGSFLVKNKYLDKILKEINKDPDWLEKQWAKVIKNNGSSQELDCLSEEQKQITKTAFEMDQHWLVEQADVRQQYVCMSQSLNLFFPAGVDASYFNSVHLKAMKSEYLQSLYYARMSREVKADTVKEIERKAITDWLGDECLACSG
jgi:ribonucleoside-diphosphate reductase alpha chain